MPPTKLLCPECGKVPVVIGSSKHHGVIGYFCGTKGCKHHYSGRNPWSQ